jgi:hypothetical protein
MNAEPGSGAHRDWIRAKAAAWRQAGLITATAVRRILARYDLDLPDDIAAHARRARLGHAPASGRGELAAAVLRPGRRPVLRTVDRQVKILALSFSALLLSSCFDFDPGHAGTVLEASDEIRPELLVPGIQLVQHRTFRSGGVMALRVTPRDTLPPDWSLVADGADPRMSLTATRTLSGDGPFAADLASAWLPVDPAIRVTDRFFVREYEVRTRVGGGNFATVEYRIRLPGSVTSTNGVIAQDGSAMWLLDYHALLDFYGPSDLVLMAASV